MKGIKKKNCTRFTRIGGFNKKNTNVHASTSTVIFNIIGTRMVEIIRKNHISNI